MNEEELSRLRNAVEDLIQAMYQVTLLILYFPALRALYLICQLHP